MLMLFTMLSGITYSPVTSYSIFMPVDFRSRRIPVCAMCDFKDEPVEPLPEVESCEKRIVAELGQVTSGPLPERFTYVPLRQAYQCRG